MKYYNACIYDRNDTLLRDTVITADISGNITGIAQLPDYVPEDGDTDCNGLVAIPSFMDSIVTLPGKEIFRLHGLDLSESNSLEEYLQLISATVSGRGIRGFGYNTLVLGEDGAARIKRIMDTMHPSTPCYIYADDMTNVIVNECVLEAAKCHIMVDKNMHTHGVLDLHHIAVLRSHTTIFDFTPDELRLSLLSFQNTMFAKGVTAIRVLDVFGGENMIKAVASLSKAGMWKIMTALYVPVYPFDSPEDIEERVQTYRSAESSNSYTVGISMTLDGSIDSGQAALIQPYEVDKGWTGDILWNTAKLRTVASNYIYAGFDININAYGDRAVSTATDVLASLVSKPNMGHKFITHCYLMSDMDIQTCKDSEITLCIEPNAVPYHNSFYEGDRVMLGDRVYMEYPVGRLLYSGISVLSGSNIPVQPEISPIDGMYKASHRTGAEDATPYQIMQTYTDNAYTKFGLTTRYGKLEIGKKATFILVDKDVINMREDLLCDCSYVATIVDGTLMWINEKRWIDFSNNE